MHGCGQLLEGGGNEQPHCEVETRFLVIFTGCLGAAKWCSALVKVT